VTLPGLARLCTALVAGLIVSSSATAQVITGTLLERSSNQPIDLGYIALLTESGEAVASTIASEYGRFTLRAPEPGAFLLQASALGYRKSVVGVFDIGVDGLMQVEFRLELEAMTLQGLVVQAERVGEEPTLVNVGFYERIQRGLGHFITPEDIEQSPVLATAELFFGIPGVQLAPTTSGNQVVMTGTRGLCPPTIYVDGVPTVGATVESIAPRPSVYAIEVYRRGTEIPIEFSAVRSGPVGSCGVILIWTRKH
jgi:hypothetical protein